MKKAIVSIFAFVLLFGFAVSGAMAQTWTWDTNAGQIMNGKYFDEFVVTDNVLYGCIADVCETLTLTTTTASNDIDDGNLDLDLLVDTLSVPPFAVIDANTVGALAGSGYAPVDPQPLVPESSGAFTHIAAGSNGTVYLIFESESTVQYVITGTSDMTWEEATVRFTPRSLNLGSNGRWITCKISDLPDLPDDTYTWEDVVDGLCIVAVNDIPLTSPICRDSNGPANTKNDTKLMVKFNRKALADEISAQQEANPDLDKTSTKITLAYSDGTLNFYGEDTIKTKPAKVKKEKKK